MYFPCLIVLKKTFQIFTSSKVHNKERLVMKQIKNDSLQSISVFFNTEKGCKEKWLTPGESVVVPESYITEQIKTLHRRRIFKITNA